MHMLASGRGGAGDVQIAGKLIESDRKRLSAGKVGNLILHCSIGVRNRATHADSSYGKNLQCGIHLCYVDYDKKCRRSGGVAVQTKVVVLEFQVELYFEWQKLSSFMM